MKEREPRNRDATGVAEVVRAFYEDHPYPPPVDDLEKYRAWEDPKKRRAEYHLLWPSRTFEKDHSILVAGCGTSQAAKHAMRWPKARVTGIDFSETSVRATAELKRRYLLDNLEVHLLPIERVRELETRFDQVVCTGVLHHLADPDAGLAALCDVLAPGGAMNVMLYAPYGRTGIYMLQDFCKRVGISATDGEIRNLIDALKALPPGHPLQHLLRDAPDFRNEAALADALLHPCDRAYSVPQLFDFLRRGGLRFGRWARQAAYSPRCGVMAQLPQSSRMQQLPVEEQYAATELFRGTMLRHSVIAHRNDDAPDGVERISFAGDAWLGYVPIRMPDTVCVRERLPSGAAAVLISQSHTYHDIYLPIDATEMLIVDSIDGDRSIGDIVRQESPSSQVSPLDAARAFFERLWWHDQVVFDISGRERR